MNNKIKFNLENVDVTDIIKQVHENIQSRGCDIGELKRLSEGIKMPSAGSDMLLSERINENLSALNNTNHIQYWWEMQDDGKLSSKAKTFFKKIIRKYSYFYMKQVFDQQNAFNLNAAHCINDLSDYCRILENQHNELTTRMNSIQLSLDELQKAKGVCENNDSNKKSEGL